MRTFWTVSASAAVLLLASSAMAADLKSGPQEGDLLSPFDPVHCSGPDKGKAVCLV